MKYTLTILSIFTAVYASAADLPTIVSNDVYRLFESEVQVTLVHRDRSGDFLKYFGVEEISCTKSPTSVCKMLDAPPNENVTPIEVRGNAAEQLISILNRIQPGILTHKGFYCVNSEKDQQSRCRVL